MLDRQGHDQRVSQQDEEWKAAGHSSLVSEMVKTKGEAWVDMITDLVNQILVKGVIPAERELSTIVNCLKGK